MIWSWRHDTQWLVATHTHSVSLSLISKLVLETRFLVGKFQPPLGTLLLALQLLLLILPERGERKRGEEGREEEWMGRGEWRGELEDKRKAWGGGKWEKGERKEWARAMMHKPWVTLTDLMLVTPMLLQKSLKTCLDRKCRKSNQREILTLNYIGHLDR